MEKLRRIDISKSSTDHGRIDDRTTKGEMVDTRPPGERSAMMVELDRIYKCRSRDPPLAKV